MQTVRVANSRSPTGYMIINAHEYRELVHGPLWHEQEPGFDGILPTAEPARAYSPEEQRRAAGLMFDAIEMQREREEKPAFATLTPQQRLDLLEEMRRDLHETRARHLQSTRMAPPPEPEVVVPEGVVPGETPGWPVDAETGKPLRLSDEERQRIADEHAALEAERAEVSRQAPPNNGEGETGTSQPTPAPATEATQAGETPAWLRAGAQVAQQAPTPPVAARSVEKGPGGKWYVMEAGKPVSEGYKTKGEAEANNVETTTE
jgi:hypothetical protein